MKIETFEGRIRKVSRKAGGDWYLEVYGTEGQRHNGNYDIAEDMVETAKEMSGVPQKLCLISYSWKVGRIVRIESLG